LSEVVGNQYIAASASRGPGNGEDTHDGAVRPEDRHAQKSSKALWPSYRWVILYPGIRRRIGDRQRLTVGHHPGGGSIATDLDVRRGDEVC
jgi:hypothetical protein